MSEDRKRTIPSHNASSVQHSLDEAVRVLPSMKYAKALVGIAATIGAGKLFLSGVNPIAGGLVAFAGLFLLIVFNAAVTTRRSRFNAQAVLIVWFITILFVVAVTAAFTSVAFGWPRDFHDYLVPAASAAAAKQHKEKLKKDRSDDRIGPSQPNAEVSRHELTTNNVFVSNSSEINANDILARWIDSGESIKLPEADGNQQTVFTDRAHVVAVLGSSHAADIEEKLRHDYRELHPEAVLNEQSEESQEIKWKAQKLSPNLDVLATIALDGNNPHSKEAEAIVNASADKVLDGCKNGSVFNICKGIAPSYILVVGDASNHYSMGSNLLTIESRSTPFTASCIDEFLSEDERRKIHIFAVDYIDLELYRHFRENVFALSMSSFYVRGSLSSNDYDRRFSMYDVLDVLDIKKWSSRISLVKYNPTTPDKTGDVGSELLLKDILVELSLQLPDYGSYGRMLMHNFGGIIISPEFPVDTCHK